MSNTDARDPSNTAMQTTQQGGAMTTQQPGALQSVTSKIFDQFPEQNYNVLAPRTHMDGLPAGTRLAITEVMVNPDKNAGEVFPIAGGQLLIGKPKLDAISAGAGISWLEEKRTDPNTHPHYVEMFVRGKVTDFDGTVREITGTKAIDLREDAGGGIPGKDYDEIVTKARGARTPRDPSGQLMEARKFIHEIAASKAKNRAIASALGIKRSYTREQLGRPFVIPKLVLDTNHPAAQDVVLANLSGATAALYGAKHNTAVVDAEFEEAAPAPQLPPPPEEPEHNPQTGEVNDQPGGESALTVIRDAWGKAKAAGMNVDTFVGLCRNNTGKDRKEDMTTADANMVLAAVEAFIAASEGMPI